ncbi:hypothetical protein, partial [Thiolapillus sp.]|uniref:hypothetical protein n=1 Tax=Thiolapillus sp. TaxID=2017437 RepID=UPI003AF98862
MLHHLGHFPGPAGRVLAIIFGVLIEQRFQCLAEIVIDRPFSGRVNGQLACPFWVATVAGVSIIRFG